MLDTKIIVTTSQRPSDECLKLAHVAAERLGGVFVQRAKMSLAKIRDEYGVPFVVVAKSGELVLDSDDGEFFFHPSMAHVRIKNLRHGASDHLIEALGAKSGMSILDCTLGLGSDAIVESFSVGEVGRVVGLEASPVIFGVVRFGLAHYAGENDAVTSAMRRVEVVHADYMDYLASLPDDSFDAVYFDPMFRHPLTKSASMHPLRAFADMRPLSHEAIGEALRVARRRVVMKENSMSREFERLGFAEFVGGKYSKIRFGVMRK